MTPIQGFPWQAPTRFNPNDRALAPRAYPAGVLDVPTNPAGLPGLDLWVSSASGLYADTNAEILQKTAGGAIQTWRGQGPRGLTFRLNSYGGGFYGPPTLRFDNGYPVVESRNTSNSRAALTADIPTWEPHAITVHWLAKMRPGSTETYQPCIGMNVDTGMRHGGIWDIGNPLLATGAPNPDCYGNWCADGGYHLMSYSREGTYSRIYFDGAKIYEGPDTATKTIINTYWLMGFRVGDLESWQYVADGWVYRAAHTGDQVAALDKWCRLNRSAIYPKTTTPSPDVFVYFIGNSIWTTAFTTFPSVPTRASTSQTKWSRWINASLGGQATGGGGTSHGVGMINRLGPEYGPILRGRPEATKVAIIFEITNDMALGGATPAQAYANYVTLAQGLKARGASKVVAVTCLPRPQILEADRTTVNNLVVANADGAWDAVCPVHTDASIGLAGTNVPPNYFADQIHLTSTGADIMAPLLRTTLSGIL